MTIDTTRIEMAKQMAGAYVLGNTEILGLIVESDDCYCRNWCAACRNTVTGVAGTMIAGVWRSLDQKVLEHARYI
jgi:hypothetical protein